MSKESIFNRFWRNNCPQTQLSADFLVNVIDKAMDEYAQEQVKNLTIPVVMPRYFKERRQKLNMSMQNVTDKTDISKATISRIERGQDAFYKTIVALDKFYSDNGA